MIEQFILLFALIITGYLCKWRGIITDEMGRGLNKFIIAVSFPCLILHRMVNLEISHAAFSGFLIAAGISLGLFGIFAIYAYVYTTLRKYDHEKKPIAEFSIISPNNGFMGFPVAVTFLGSLGLLYMVACNLALNLMFFTYGVVLMKRGRESEKKSVGRIIWDFLKLIINPKISAAVVGLVMCYNSIALPSVVDNFVEMVGAIASPMALIFIGSTLYGSSFIKIIKNIKVTEIAINKLIIMPLITLAVVYFIPISPVVKAILVLSNALPVATTVPIFSELYDRDKVAAGEALFLSTVLSIGTIPLCLMLIEFLFL